MVYIDDIGDFVRQEEENVARSVLLYLSSWISYSLINRKRGALEMLFSTRYT